MQAGFDPAMRHLGTPVEATLKEAIATGPPRLPANDHATRLMEALWLSPDLAFKEKDALFVRAPTVLQGLNLTNPPTGGFSTAARSVVVGAGPGGAEFNTRLSTTVFMQPGYPGKRMEVGPADAVQVSPVAPPFREPDGKTRNPHGHMTVARMDQEAAANAARLAGMQDAFDPPLEPDEDGVTPSPSPLPPSKGMMMLLGENQGPVADSAAVAAAGSSQFGSTLFGSASSQPFGGSPALAMAALERAVTTEDEDVASRGVPASVSVPGPVPVTSRPKAMHQKLGSWWKDFLVAPMDKNTWAKEDQWVPVALLFMGAVILALLCVVLTRRRSTLPS